MQLDFKMIGFEERAKARTSGLNLYERRHPEKWLKMDRRELKRIVREHVKSEPRYKSLIGSIIASIVIRLIISLIIDWATKGLKSPPAVYSMGEPGYE